MLFNSFTFAWFFPLVVCAYFALPHRWRWILLLASSFYFYMCWRVEYVVLIVFSILLDYSCGRMMGRYPTRAGRRPFLILSLVGQLGLLFAFKYYNFFSHSLRVVLERFNILYDLPVFHVLLPVGLSFYTFQTLSYSIDVYRGVREPERHLGIFALFVTFFPQLVAGPISRSTHLLPQFRERHDFNYGQVVDGLRQMALGYFKKLVVADRLAMYVNQVYGDPSQYYGLPIGLATYFFAFQIYCDFSGYSDIAIGSARVMGYDVVQNFRTPYFSGSIREFWSRWHISLSTWFRDYLYIPLGGNRLSRARRVFNLMAVFLVSGLWHGANWTFAVWGALHGLYMVCSLGTRSVRDRIAVWVGLDRYPRVRRALAIILTFHLVLFSWVFFRARSLAEVGLLLRHAATFSWAGAGGSTAAVLGTPNLILCILAVVGIVMIDLVQRNRTISECLDTKPGWVRWSWYYAAICLTIVFGVFEESPFIYFQF